MTRRLFSLALALAVCSAEAGSPAVMKPGGTDATPRVLSALERLQDGGVLRFERGEYRFLSGDARRMRLDPSNNASGEKHVIFPLVGRRNVTVDGGGSRFVFGPGAFPFAILRSEGIVLKGFSVECEVAPYVSGTVVADDGKGFVFRVDAGSAQMDLSQRHISLHGIDRQRQCFYRAPNDPEPADWIPTRFMCFSPEARGGGTWYMRYADDPSPKCVRGYYASGERVAFNLSGNRDRVFCFAEDARDLSLEDVRIVNFGGMGVLAQRSEDITLVRYVALPAEGRPVTLTADAAHFVNCRGRVRLEDCELSWGLDDVCNVHGNYLEVTGASGHDAELRIGHFEQRGFMPYRVGDAVEFIERRRRSVLCKAKVTAARLLAPDRVRITVDAILDGVPAGALVEDVTACPDVVIRNCRFHDYPHLRLSGRGRMLVEDCSFRRSAVGIFAYDLAEYWYESGRIADLTIRNNIFEGCNVRGDGVSPAIRIGLTGWKPGDEDMPLIHGTVRLQGNVFRNCGERACEAYGVKDCQCKDGNHEK